MSLLLGEDLLHFLSIFFNVLFSFVETDNLFEWFILSFFQAFNGVRLFCLHLSMDLFYSLFKVILFFVNVFHLLLLFILKIVRKFRCELIKMVSNFSLCCSADSCLLDVLFSVFFDGRIKLVWSTSSHFFNLWYLFYILMSVELFIHKYWKHKLS